MIGLDQGLATAAQSLVFIVLLAQATPLHLHIARWGRVEGSVAKKVVLTIEPEIFTLCYYVEKGPVLGLDKHLGNMGDGRVRYSSHSKYKRGIGCDSVS